MWSARPVESRKVEMEHPSDMHSFAVLHASGDGGVMAAPQIAVDRPLPGLGPLVDGYRSQRGGTRFESGPSPHLIQLGVSQWKTPSSGPRKPQVRVLPPRPTAAPGGHGVSVALEAVNLPDRVRAPVVTPLAPKASGDAACLSSRVETGSIPVGAAAPSMNVPLHEDVTSVYEAGRAGSSPARGAAPPRTDATRVSEAW